MSRTLRIAVLASSAEANSTNATPLGRLQEGGGGTRKKGKEKQNPKP